MLENVVKWLKRIALGAFGISGTLMAVSQEFARWVIDGIKYFISETVAWLWAQLPESMTEYIDALDFSAYGTIADIVFYLFPLSAILVIISGAYAVAGSIRILRWIKSFIPTIGD